MLVALGGTVLGAEHSILSSRLRVVNPRREDPGRRVISASAIERHSADAIVGDPTLGEGKGGAVLEVVAAGGSTTFQTFSLAQGTRADGRPFWRAIGSDGFAYADPKGEQSAVKAVRVQRSRLGTVKLAVKISGRNGDVTVLPPNPGTDGFLALTLADGDRYCVGFGPDAEIRNRDDVLWAVRDVAAEGCGAPPQASGDFLALTYNVAGLPQGISSSHPSVNTAQISPLLNSYDLVVIQESWQTPDPNPLAPLRVYHEILAADAHQSYKTFPAPLPLGHDPRRPSALVSDGLNVFSRFPFTSLQRQMWNGCWSTAADCLAEKGFMVVRTTLAPGVSVDVYTLHDEAGGDPEDERLRDEGMTQVIAFMSNFSAGRAVILGGDFNLHTDVEPDSSTYHKLLDGTGLTDVCAALSCPQPGRIDKFAFRSGGNVTIAPTSWHFETEIFHDAMGEPLSDHDPLAVRFQWTAS
jgi:hypothetical protein